MKRTSVVNNILAILSLAGMVYCFAVFFYLQPALVPALAEPTPLMNALGSATWLVYALVGIQHLVLLVHVLNVQLDQEKSSFLYSIYIVAVLGSGLTLLSDITILSDIGKEYRFWDVSQQWFILYGFTLFHLLVVAYGTVFRRTHPSTNQRIFDVIRSGNDTLFLSLNQISLICGVLGICGVVFPISGLMDTVIPERFQTAYMLFLSALALVPVLLFAVYWLVKNRDKPLSTWLDEKQTYDAATGALVSLMVTLPLMGIFTILSVWVARLQAPFWLLLAFFTQLIALSGTVISRNRMTA